MSADYRTAAFHSCSSYFIYLLILLILTAGLKLTLNRPVSVSSVSSGSFKWLWQISSRPTVHSENNCSSSWSRHSRTRSHFWRTSSTSAHPRGLTKTSKQDWILKGFYWNMQELHTTYITMFATVQNRPCSVHTHESAGRGCSCWRGYDYEAAETIWGCRPPMAYSSPE